MADCKNNSGALFKNDAKRDTKDRDYSGQAMIDGAEYWISGWDNTSKSGTKYLGLTFKPKEAKAAPKPQAPGSDWLDEAPAPSGPGGGDDDLDSETPF